MSEKINYKVELIDYNELTSEKIEDGYLLGVRLKTNGIDSVTILKNEYNGIVGEVPNSMWRCLSEDIYIVKQEQEELTKNDCDFEKLHGDINDIAEALGQDFSFIMHNIKDFGETLQAKTKTKITEAENFIYDLEREDVPKKFIKNIVSKVLNENDRLVLKAQRARLNALLDIAESENVSTKGFAKK